MPKWLRVISVFLAIPLLSFTILSFLTLSKITVLDLNNGAQSLRYVIFGNFTLHSEIYDVCGVLSDFTDNRYDSDIILTKKHVLFFITEPVTQERKIWYSINKMQDDIIYKIRQIGPSLHKEDRRTLFSNLAAEIRNDMRQRDAKKFEIYYQNAIDNLTVFQHE